LSEPAERQRLPLLEDDDLTGEAVIEFHPGVGAPLAGAMLEQVIARGVRAVIACGAAVTLTR
jgi:uridine phosphorylase